MRSRGLTDVAWLVLMFIVAASFWHHPVLYPLKALTVFFHEICHGLTAAATGGTIVKIELSPALGGVCFHRGGVELLVLPAGYLGSMLFGAAILLVAARTRWDRQISVMLGLFLFAMTMLYMRNPFGFGLGLAWAVGLVLLGRKAPDRVNDLFLQFLGLTSMLYAVVDIKEDLIDRTVWCSDAAQFARVVGGPPAFWGILWILVALVCSALVLRAALMPQGGEEPDQGRVSIR